MARSDISLGSECATCWTLDLFCAFALAVGATAVFWRFFTFLLELKDVMRLCGFLTRSNLRISSSSVY